MTKIPWRETRILLGMFVVGLFAASGVSAASSSPALSSSSVSLIETAKGLIPPAAFCFADDAGTQNSLVPLSVRTKVREWIRADKYSCSKVSVPAEKPASASPKIIEETGKSAFAWLKEKLNALAGKIFDWLWKGIKSRAKGTLGL